MRRCLAVAPLCLLLGLLACASEMPIEDARNAAIVTVDGASLDGATLEQVLLASPASTSGPSRESASIVLSAFIDAALLREALVRGDSLTDSTLVHEAILPDAIRGQILTHLQRRATTMPEVTDQQADSIGRLGTVRVLQHILIRVTDQTDTVAVRAAVERAGAVLEQARTPGTDFAALAQRVSQDTMTARSGGFLPALTRRELPPGRLAETAWGLSPGDVSALVGSPAGIHVLRRASLVEARPALKQWLRPVLVRQADSVWVDSLATSRGLTIAGDAVSRLRQLGVEPFRVADDAPFVSWQGGELTAEETRTWLTVLPATERAAMPGAPDSVLVLFLEQLAQRDLVAGETPEGAGVSATAWQALAPQFRNAVTAISEQYRDALVVGDSNLTLRTFLVAVSSGERPYRPLPGGLAGILRRNADVEINDKALNAIIAATARQWRLEYGKDSAAADSAAAADSGASATP